MSRIIKVKNNSGSGGTWVGQTIAIDAYYQIPDEKLRSWITNSQVFADIGNGNLVVNNGTDTVNDIVDPLDGWNWVANDEPLPISNLDGKKLAVHSSPKPTLDIGTSYAIWSGAGDNVADSTDIGGGDILYFDCQIGTSTVIKEIKFNWNHGRVWIHEGYLRFQNGGPGDYMESKVWAEATPLQTSVNFDLEVTSNLIKLAAGGPGTGTHGWADATKIVLIPRLYDKDGDWDYDGINLTPNTGLGSYRISDIDQPIQKYFNKIPCSGSTGNYFTMTSDETTELPSNYYLTITAHNISNTNWDASVIVELYREKTI